MTNPTYKQQLEQWQQRWQQRDIGFHQSEVNANLVKYLPELSLNTADRVMVPLCGKTQDIDWLLEQGFQVLAVELSHLAVDAIFQRLGGTPHIEYEGDLSCYRSSGLEIWQGDIFALKRALLPPVQAVYDRGALVALPKNLRTQYARLMSSLTAQAPQLLITCDYPDGALQGSPYAVSAAEVRRLYAQNYRIRRLQRQPVEGGLKGVEYVMSEVWHVYPL